MLKNLQCILIVIIGVGILTGCGKSMTDEEAENIIKKWYPQKSDAYAITFSIGINRIDSNDDLLRQLEELKKKGLIDYKPTGVQLKDPNFKDVAIQITGKGNPYIENTGSSPGVKMILLVLENFEQITNVSAQGNYVKVDYTTLYEPAEPFTDEEVNRIAPGCLDEKVTHSVYFLKKDNEWQLAPGI